MAVDTAKPKWSVDETDRSSQSSGDSRTRRLTFTVTTDAPAQDTTDDAEQASGIPAFGDSHPRDFSARLVRRRARRVALTLFEVDCEYESRGADDQSTLDEHPVKSYSSIITEEEIDVDIRGMPIQTMAFEGFDPPVRSPRSTRVLRVTRNMRNYFDGIGSLYEGKVNSDTFQGYPPGTCWLAALNADEVRSKNLSYWRITAEIHIRGAAPGSINARAWWKRVLHQGYYAKLINESDSSIWKRVPCIDDQGRRATKPMPLKLDGSQEFDKNAPAVWLEFEQFQSISFNSMRLL